MRGRVPPPATWEWMLLATALQATVPRMASPIDPPTCWPTFSSDEATPASLSATLISATSDSGTKISPHAGRGDHHRPEQPGGVVAVLVDPRQPEHAAGADERAD